MSQHHVFCPLYGIDKKGAIKIWEASVGVMPLGPNNTDIAVATIEYGLLGGKRQITTRQYTVGKNIGKSNETTPFQQAVAETRSKWNDKKNKEAYSESIPSSNSNNQQQQQQQEQKQVQEQIPNPNPTVYLPMLAHTFSGTGRQKIVFPCFVQPKLDGVRCVAHCLNSNSNVVIMQSRTGAAFTSLDHISTALSPVLGVNNRFVLDGEIYTTEMPFEELVGLVKTKKLTDAAKEKLAKVQYHVYDVYDKQNPDLPFSERTKLVANIVEQIENTNNNSSIAIRWVDTQRVSNMDEFRDKFGEYVGEGYEGIMLRNADGKYRFNYRSHDLQKYKEFVEQEYKIIGFNEGAGRDQGTVIWVCETETGRPFNVRPRGTQEMRRQWFQDGPQYIGKSLTVIYQELSEGGVPRFPVGKCIREGY